MTFPRLLTAFLLLPALAAVPAASGNDNPGDWKRGMCSL